MLAHGQWFSPGTPASSTTKTGRHDIAKILLKVALNTKHQIKSNQDRLKYTRNTNRYYLSCVIARLNFVQISLPMFVNISIFKISLDSPCTYYHTDLYKSWFFYSQTCLWLKTTWNTFKSWTINMFKIHKKKRNGSRTIFKRTILFIDYF